MKHPLQEMMDKRREGIRCGIPSYCSANELVIEIALRRAKERNNPECGAFFQTGHPQHGCAAKQTRQRSRQDDFASGSSRLQVFGQPCPWLHGQRPGPHRQGGGPDRKAGW